MQEEKIVVLGGSGFIGAEICRLGVLMGHRITSVSRRGRPAITADWVDKVNWVKADATKPEEWAANLAGCKALIHSLAVIREQDGATYRKINTGSMEVASQEADKARVGKLVYISVNDSMKMLPGFFESKRQAEQLLKSHNFKYAILRPALVYGPRRSPTVVAGSLMRAVEGLPLVGGAVRSNHPLSVLQVAAASLVAAFDEKVEGLLTIADIEKLAGIKLRTYAAAK